ncbi:MAG: UTP--glucose-1-phosphate uridylyltransferase GalU [Actinomycetes bacterium]|jgi:UTP--glucose-1-phosphate uridylyltransferase|nr:UTP--glucose-1-phosphate uridylyltransferase GalU [Actinomycetes bacterium]
MKAIIPAAGLGTRFLPVTKAQPKEMLPVLDKPIMQYVVEEAAAAGAADILLITGRGKRVLEDHFDRSAELERILAATGAEEKLKKVQTISNLADIFYVRQKAPKGLGHAIARGAAFVGNEPFYVLLGDVIVPDCDILPRLKAVYDHTKVSVIAVQRVTRNLVSRYGIIDGESQTGLGEGVYKLHGLVEKPSATEAPSDLAIIGRYLLTPAVMDVLAQTQPGAGGEIQLTDALVALLRQEDVYAVEVEPYAAWDTGNVLSWLEANVALALSDERYVDELQEMLLQLLAKPKSAE